MEEAKFKEGQIICHYIDPTVHYVLLSKQPNSIKTGWMWRARNVNNGTIWFIHESYGGYTLTDEYIIDKVLEKYR
jgi:hypothetical protein